MKSLMEEGHSAEAIFEALSTQQTELVLTAHPTQVNRRTILEKQRRVQTVSCSKRNVTQSTAAFDSARKKKTISHFLICTYMESLPLFHFSDLVPSR